MAAEMYLRKRDAAAREIASRAGTPYGSESVSDQRAYELFWQRDPEADEQRAWMEGVAAVQAGKLPADRLAVFVVEKVYPARLAVVEGDGRTDLKAQAAFIKRMVERKQREDERTEQVEPAPETAPEGMMTDAY